MKIWASRLVGSQRNRKPGSSVPPGELPTCIMAFVAIKWHPITPMTRCFRGEHEHFPADAAEAVRR